MKILGTLKSFFWCAPQLSGANILCFHILSFPQGVAAVWWLLYCRYFFFFPSQFPSGSMAHAWKWLQSRMTVTYFVYWFGRQYFISLMGEFEGTLMYLNGLYIKWSWNWNTSDLNPAQIQCGTWSHRFFWFVCFVFLTKITHLVSRLTEAPVLSVSVQNEFSERQNDRQEIDVLR